MTERECPFLGKIFMTNVELFEIRKLIVQVDSFKKHMKDEYFILTLSLILSHLRDLEDKLIS
jgi:hypothetical protein